MMCMATSDPMGIIILTAVYIEFWNRGKLKSGYSSRSSLASYIS